MTENNIQTKFIDSLTALMYRYKVVFVRDGSDNIYIINSDNSIDIGIDIGIDELIDMKVGALRYE